MQNIFLKWNFSKTIDSWKISAIIQFVAAGNSSEQNKWRDG